MTGTTITTTIGHTVTLGSAYPSPLTITTAGAIAPTADTATGLYLPASASLATIVNHGFITAGAGTYDSNDFAGLAGGTAVLLASGATLANTGTIAGGAGGSSDTGGPGGLGIDVLAAATITNSGLIEGGTGGYGYFGAGAGGLGIALAVHATLTNSGTIRGGAGNSSHEYPSGTDSAGGIAVSAASEAVITNTGLIVGGAAGVGGYYYGQRQIGALGGTALILQQGGSLTNSASIIGGAGGNAFLGSLGGPGGLGVYVAAASVTNTGLIAGGTGGYVEADRYVSTGGRGGNALYATDGAIVANSGRIAGGAGGGSEAGGAGGYGVTISGGATVTNTGHISGGAGAYAINYFLGGNGGDGVVIGSGYGLIEGAFINHGTVTAGAGGYGWAIPSAYGSPTRFGGNGGDGIVISPSYLNSGVSLANYGAVIGGAGGSLTTYGSMASYGTAGYGGAGVIDSGLGFTNHGTITGGAGGISGSGPGLGGTGGTGGFGVLLQLHATLTNSGTISGGIGGANVEHGVAGGVGVYIYGSTLIDSGKIAGGAGGVSTYDGTRGDAVLFGGTVAGTLELDPAATLTGLVVANGSAFDVLELAGTSTGTLTGFGSSFIGFGVLSFASGAERIIEGSVPGFQDLFAITGFAQHDVIVLDSFTAVLKQTEILPNGLDLFNSLGGFLLPLSHATGKDLLLTDGGGKTTIAAIGTTAHTIGTNMAQFVLSGGTSDHTKLTAGGFEAVASGGTATASTIAGGALTLDIGGHLTGGLTFSTVTGGKLVIDSATMPTTTISGFIAGDTIALAGVAYNSHDTVTVATAGTVTVKTPGTNYNLDIAGATVGETDFHFGAGSLLTKSASPARMTFLSPETPAQSFHLPTFPNLATLFKTTLPYDHPDHPTIAPTPFTLTTHIPAAFPHPTDTPTALTLPNPYPHPA